MRQDLLRKPAGVFDRGLLGWLKRGATKITGSQIPHIPNIWDCAHISKHILSGSFISHPGSLILLPCLPLLAYSPIIGAATIGPPLQSVVLKSFSTFPRFLLTGASLSLIILPGIAQSPASFPISTASLTDLEQRVAVIDEQLDQLAEYSLRTGVGSVGYRSKTHSTSSDSEWIQISLREETVVDQIVLVPTIWRDNATGLRADGFPIEFRILAGTTQNPDGELIAQVGSDADLLPRIAPYVVPLPPTPAKWIRLEVDRLSPRLWDGQYVLQLSEILIFSGPDNVALHQPVVTSSPQPWLGYARHKRFLVDGFVPYLMNAREGEKSVAFNSKVGIGDQPHLTVDLGRKYPVNRIHLHGPDLSDTIPQAMKDDYGVSRHWLVQGTNHADFSDPSYLFEYELNSIYDVGPILMHPFPETTCRYIRLIALDPYIGFNGNTRGSQIALAEIEVFSRGQNIAHGCPAVASFGGIPDERSLAALTDGRNFYGNILPIRTWVEQLAHRHDLETERPLVIAELNERYALQKRNLRWMGWLAAGLTVGIIIVVLADRIIRLRHVANVKKRLAADLHDELGANIHTIGLLSDAASLAHDSPEELKMLNNRIRQMTERTGLAIRHCTNMMESKELYIGLAADIRRTAQSNLGLLKHEIVIEGEEYLERLKPRTRVDLFLFYKECLVNVCRHSGATKFATQLTAHPDHLTLSISDNGRGLSDLPEGKIPASLSRRARLLRATIDVKTVPQHGTSITLRLKTKRFGFRI